MSQNDMSLANASGAAFRSDLNNALQALASVSSGSSAPSTTYAFQVWLDTTTATAPIINSVILQIMHGSRLAQLVLMGVFHLLERAI